MRDRAAAGARDYQRVYLARLLSGEKIKPPLSEKSMRGTGTFYFEYMTLVAHHNVQATDWMDLLSALHSYRSCN